MQHGVPQYIIRAILNSRLANNDVDPMYGTNIEPLYIQRKRSPRTSCAPESMERTRTISTPPKKVPRHPIFLFRMCT